jgi:hypothetical protein
LVEGVEGVLCLLGVQLFYVLDVLLAASKDPGGLEDATLLSLLVVIAFWDICTSSTSSSSPSPKDISQKELNCCSYVSPTS